ncbi:hypothetical protein TEA_027894 [Camellia sinensis var. sinensis]|uniref:HD/PDEase domain-containing protein n=1 Tax=Camellia sinensis var. sinensis TaxID=542762 RepID=A0A4V3WKT1_CAMSN|nr:hypothetical protein TEA_027894 [Camellia sinensis var. sinensis]
MGKSETVKKAEKLMVSAMKANDASHDASHVFRVRDLALSLALEEGLSSSPDSMEIVSSASFKPFMYISWQVELAALLHDIGDYKYMRLVLHFLVYMYKDPSEEKIVEEFLEAENVEGSKKIKILSIIKGMGFKDEIGGQVDSKHSIEFGVVQDADRLDAIGAIGGRMVLHGTCPPPSHTSRFPLVSGIARCFTFGGSRSSVLHDPSIQPRSDLSKEQYIKKDKQTTVNHFHEKLLKLKDLMKTKAGQRRAEKRHKFMEDFLKEFYDEWDGRA